MMRWRWLQNLVIVSSLVGLFSQGAFAQLPGTFSPLTAVAAGGALDCTGGTVTYVGGNTIHKFTQTGSLLLRDIAGTVDLRDASTRAANGFVCTSPHTVNYLAVGGGGAGGGASYSGGGGAGGLLTGTFTAPVGTTNVVVGAGGAAVAAQRGGNGQPSSIAIPGGAGSWYAIIPTQSGAAAGSGFTNYELRTRWNAAGYSGAPTVGTQLRVTIAGGGSGYNALAGLYCGHAAAGASTSLNYDGTQVQIKFAGSASATVPATASPLVSDVVNYSFDNTKDFICSMNWGSTQFIQGTGKTNVSSGTNPGQNAANTTFAGAAGTVGNYTGPVVSLEVFSTYTLVANALGGGGGGQYSSFVPGATGASGGGGAYGATLAQQAAGTAGQGFAGGYNATAGCGAGGGGAGAVGPNCTSPNGSNGGAGIQSAITGTLLWYAAGGAGGPYTGVGGTGGSGIGGNGGNYSPATSCTEGAPNTGSGSGGIASTGLCNGADGAVIIAYPTGIPVVTPPPPCTANTDGGGTFANVQGLYHFDNTGTDTSSFARNGVANSPATFSTTQKKFGTRSYLGGGSASFTVTSGAFLTMPGDFTVELWAYWTAAPGYEWFFGDSAAAQTVNLMKYNSSAGSLWDSFSGSPQTVSYGTPALNQWIHYAWVRAGATQAFYVNGVAQALSGTMSTATVGGSTYRWVFGNSGTSAGGGYAHQGYMDELRISNIARYTANFTPPAYAFCDN